MVKKQQNTIFFSKMTQIKLKFTEFYSLAFNMHKTYSVFFKHVKHSIAKIYSF